MKAKWDGKEDIWKVIAKAKVFLTRLSSYVRKRSGQVIARELDLFTRLDGKADVSGFTCSLASWV